jgi:AGZA family xanthine/uracil permease-like MFS transporter
VFLALSLVGFRSGVMNAIPDALKSGIAAGIGLFIAVIGFNYGNLVVARPNALIGFPGLQANPVGVLTLIGLALTMTLLAFRIRGAILLGILGATVVALVWGQVSWCGWPVSWPSGLAETAGGYVPGLMDLWSALISGHAVEVITFMFVLLFMDLFDTVGTLVGVAGRSGLMRNGELPGAEKALSADAAGTIIGGCLGTSTVTSYIESITGVESGARTGLAAVAAGVLMGLAVFCQPLARMVGGGIPVEQVVMVGGAGHTITALKYPLIAPALIVVGALMIRTIRQINWDDATEYLPAFLTMVAMPLAYSIAAGIAIGFVSYAFGKLVTGRVKQCPVLVYVFAALFVLRYIIAQ